MYVLYVYVCTHAAIANLNGVTLYGKKIHVTLSKHSTVQMPQAGSNVSSGELHVDVLYIRSCTNTGTP